MNWNAIVIDDSEIARQFIQASLAEVGFSCVADYGCPAQALVALAQERIATDVIITDFMMPAMDGLDLSRFCAAPRARLGHFPFESDRAFPTQC